MGLTCTVTPTPVRRKGFFGKIRNMIEQHLDDKISNGCPQLYCQMSNNAYCGPRCGYSGCGLVGCKNTAACFQRGRPCCGPATWSPFFPATILRNCCYPYCGQC